MRGSEGFELLVDELLIRTRIYMSLGIFVLLNSGQNSHYICLGMFCGGCWPKTAIILG